MERLDIKENSHLNCVWRNLSPPSPKLQRLQVHTLEKISIMVIIFYFLHETNVLHTKLEFLILPYHQQIGSVDHKLPGGYAAADSLTLIFFVGTLSRC